MDCCVQLGNGTAVVPSAAIVYYYYYYYYLEYNSNSNKGQGFTAPSAETAEWVQRPFHYHE